MASTQSLFPKAINLYEQRDPMRNLWRNVLIVALEDALGRYALNKNYGYSRTSSAKLARSYFTEPNGDFKMVCTLAGFDHEYIRMKATKYLERKKKENDKENLSTM
jgi:hypothetical protein